MDKKQARRLVASAVRSGRLARPYGCTCNGCAGHDGQCPNSLATGHRIEAHHPDYDKPLDVIWVCNPCHKVADDRTQMTASVIAQAVLLRGQGLSLLYVATRLHVSVRALRSHLARTSPHTYID